jgi:hypothetical protein
MVLVEYAWFISSIENKTPPIGEPKATATPAALAAVRISLRLTGVSALPCNLNLL